MEGPTKAEFRKQAGERIRALSKEDRSEKSKAACARLLDLPEVQAAEAILLYAPLPDELDVWPVLHALPKAGKRLILPKCRPEQQDMLCIEIGDFQRDLIRGTFNILEPKPDHGISLSELDVVIAPARAFDHQGNRVGRGAGYYDRLLIKTGLRAFKCGIAYDCQIFPAVPMFAHDVPVDVVVSESGLFRRGTS